MPVPKIKYINIIKQICDQKFRQTTTAPKAVAKKSITQVNIIIIIIVLKCVVPLKVFMNSPSPRVIIIDRAVIIKPSIAPQIPIIVPETAIPSYPSDINFA